MDTESIVRMALVALSPERVPTEEEIRDTVGRLAAAWNLDEATQADAIKRIQARSLVKMDIGFALVDKHVPWVDRRRPDIDPFYSERFKEHLQREGWPGAVVTALDRSAEKIVDLLGDPAEMDTWKRRGLVMGDVQSGKTATYSALICKAADAGYRLIILLTGTIENLRRQTQERLDAGFVGIDSSEALKRNRRDLRIGVGLVDGRRQATVFTSSAADFRQATVNSLGLRLDSQNEPVLVVIKKHTRILQNLKEWIEQRNPGIDIPVLMIDDEADNASINTADENRDPTKVNAGLRELLSLFRRTTYVGFTATPFANIFVNPDSKEEMLGDDLFPRDFIYTLDAPSNYFGPLRIFSDESKQSPWLRPIDDVEEAIPSKHKSDFQVPCLPKSLLHAVCAFLVTNAIRDLRNEGPTHRSMLVNVSHYTRVQDQIEDLLHVELEGFRKAIRAHAAWEPEKALQDGRIRALYDAWCAEFSDCGFDWPVVQGALRTAVLPVTTIAVNRRTGPTALDYRPHKEAGLRVIAVGGNSLSRGLTLEGLVVSYFRRSTKMYDTLLQMGRWFGYRPGYEDLCRIWLPQSSIDWYGHISDATEELRSELRWMHRMGRTPSDFGLAVRMSPDSLLVTARNKMRSAKEITRVISVSGESFESVELPTSGRVLRDNWEVARDFVAESAALPGVVELQAQAPRLLRGVPRAAVANLLQAFQVPSTEFRFQPDAIAGLLRSLPPDVLDRWDVAIPSGDADPITIGGWQTKLQWRSVTQDQSGAFVVSGNKRRVGSRGVEKAGLNDTELRRAEQLALSAEVAVAERLGKPARTLAELNIADRFYRASRSRPLLLVHLLQPRGEAAADLPTVPDGAVVALGLSLPHLDSNVGTTLARYKANLVKYRERHADELDAGDDDEFDEDES